MIKHGIKPPRKPKGEDPKTTIAMQDKQIQMLISRITTLETHNRAVENENSELIKQRDAVDRAFQGQMEMAASFADRLAARETAYTRLCGWQDCAREIFEGRFDIEPFPSIAPGV